MFRRVGLVAAGMAAVLAAAVGCSGGDDEGGSTAVRVGWQKNALIGLMDLVAADQGFFKARGIDVTLMPMETGQVAVTSALRGELDILYGPQSNVVQAASQGECFKVLSTGHGNSINFVARKDVSLPSKTSDAFPGGLADIKGLKVGVPNLGSATDRQARVVLKAAGINDDDVDFVAVGVGGTAVAALEGKSVDVLVVFPPASEALPKDSYQVVVDLVNNPETSPLKDVVISHQMTTCDFLEKNEQAVLGYCRAYLDARDWTTNPANRDALAQIIARHLNLEPAAAKAMWEGYGAVWNTPTKLTPEVWTAQTKYNSPQDQSTPPFDEWVYGPCATEDQRS
ncbi:ABC transporter substrate-binding protein [Micromonospora sp. NPDC047074]|uniref:ABC transporter substrate-binding protein n=1 Tax=Micromonospora sp. NPDC047074 TaxID=3154339 RepID=UPI003406B76A